MLSLDTSISRSKINVELGSSVTFCLPCIYFPNLLYFIYHFIIICLFRFSNFTCLVFHLLNAHPTNAQKKIKKLENQLLKKMRIFKIKCKSQLSWLAFCNGSETVKGSSNTFNLRIEKN